MPTSGVELKCNVARANLLAHILHISVFWMVAAASLLLFGIFWTGFWFSHSRGSHFYFDPQDCFHSNPEGRVFPRSAETATFEPILKHYIGVTQLVVTIAAASIAFGGSQKPETPILIAKLLLAWSIFYGVLFCALLLWRYDEYGQDMTSYTLLWYSTVFAFGFSCLLCFMFGYLSWGWGLAR